MGNKWKAGKEKILRSLVFLSDRKRVLRKKSSKEIEIMIIDYFFLKGDWMRGKICVLLLIRIFDYFNYFKII